MGKGDTTNHPSHKDLVKSVSKRLKYYFELRRQEDGFDLSGPECPRPDYPSLKSRPMLLYEGLHDRSVKHFYSNNDVKQQITHLTAHESPTQESKQIKRIMNKVMDKTTFVPPWTGVGNYGGTANYTKNSEKYLTGTFGEWALKSRASRRRGYGNPEPTMKRAFKDAPGAKPRVLRSTVPGFIDNKECGRLIEDASKILASSEFDEGASRPQSSRGSRRSASIRQSSSLRARSASLTSQRTRSSIQHKSKPPEVHRSYQPAPVQTTNRGVPNRELAPPLKKSAGPSHAKRAASAKPVKSSAPSGDRRLTERPQSSRNMVSRQSTASALSYHDVKDAIVQDHEERETRENLNRGKIYYDINGRKNPLRHKVRNDERYLEKDGDRAGGHTDEESGDEKVPDWLRTQMKSQDVDEKKLPYNRSVKHMDVPEPETAKGEDITKREGVRRRPKSARRSKSRSSKGDRDSIVTLSEGSYEKVDIDSGSEEDTYVEDRGCQTGWELIVNFDQTENILYDQTIDPTEYKIGVRTGTCVGASTKASISMVLYGTRGRSIELKLENCLNHKIPFQQGAYDEFIVSSSYVGNLSHIQIGHDETDTVGAAWFLDSVAVQDPRKGEVYEFVCDKWLSNKSSDKMTRRVLQIAATRNIQPEVNIEEEEPEVTEVPDDEIEKVAMSNSPRPSVARSSEGSTRLSTTHLNNDGSSAGKDEAKKSVDIDSESTTSYSVSEADSARQNRFVGTPGKGREKRELGDIEDFESDIARHSDRKSMSSRRSESTLSDSTECRTAVFEEQSVSSEAAAIRHDREKRKQEITDAKKEAYKAGERAERDRQKQQQLEEEKAKLAARTLLLSGPAIHHHAKSGNLAKVQELLQMDRELMNSVDDRGNTPLHYAALKGHNDIVKLLAAMNADLQCKDQAGYEPSHMAAIHGHVNCLITLIAMGAHINSETDDNKTPLHLAAMAGNMETCKWLVANRAHLEARDDFGRTPVDMADNNSHDDVAKFLRNCINELKAKSDKSSSLNMLLDGSEEADGGWRDDHASSRPSQHRRHSDSSEDGESTADLRKEEREREELHRKQEAYRNMQKSLQEENMTFLDKVRYEAVTG